MQFMLLLYYPDRRSEAAWADADEEERARIYAQFEAFARLAGDRIVSGNELAPSTTAVTVRRSSPLASDAVVADGPYAEVAEVVGGYFVIEAADMAEAVELAKAVPVEAVEVRPIVPEEDAG